MMGIIFCATRQLFERSQDGLHELRLPRRRPTTATSALRGLRTMGVRLRHHEKSGIQSRTG